MRLSRCDDTRLAAVDPHDAGEGASSRASDVDLVRERHVIPGRYSVAVSQAARRGSRGEQELDRGRTRAYG